MEEKQKQKRARRNKKFSSFVLHQMHAHTRTDSRECFSFVPSIMLIDETTCVCHIHSHPKERYVLLSYICPLGEVEGNDTFFCVCFSSLFFCFPSLQSSVLTLIHIITLSISGSFSHSSSLKMLHMEFQFSDSCVKRVR